MANKITNTRYYQEIADAIRAKNKSADTYTPAEMAAAIADIPTGGGVVEAPENDVIFIDYDGTILYSYSKAEFLELEALPANPDHTDIGLVAEGWNWTLSGAKTFLQTYRYITIGQTYTTEDGKDWIRIHIDEEDREFYLYIVGNLSGGKIEWGDGTETGSAGGQTHAYSAPGDYTIKISNMIVGSGTQIFGHANAGYGRKVRAVHIASNNVRGNFFYFPELEAVTCSKNYAAQYLQYRFQQCMLRGLVINADTNWILTVCSNIALNGISGFKYLSLPEGIQTYTPQSSAFALCGIKRFDTPIYRLQASTFQGAPSFKRAVFTDNLAITGGMHFYNSGIYEIEFPESIDTIPASICNTCYSLQKVILPASVTAIQSSAFSTCPSLKEVHIKATTPPTMASNNVFSGAHANLVIYVPAGTLADYQAATNWSTYASKMQEETA